MGRKSQAVEQIKVGDRYEKLVVASVPFIRKRRTCVYCDCDCGKRVVVRTNSLFTGNTRSCGCVRLAKLVARNTTHGMATRSNRSSEYTAWSNMLTRCYDETVRAFKDYGGRGITVCDRWRTSFEAFLADMGSKPRPDLTLERDNVNGNYEPGNCRWATTREQAFNRRDNRRMSHGGETLTLVEWAAKIGVTPSTLHGRLRRMSVERALTMPRQRCRFDA